MQVDGCIFVGIGVVIEVQPFVLPLYIAADEKIFGDLVSDGKPSTVFGYADQPVIRGIQLAISCLGSDISGGIGIIGFYGKVLRDFPFGLQL